MRPKSEEWFEEQRGPRLRRWPEVPVAAYSDDELRAAIHQGAAADVELQRRARWDARRESALYAWQVEPDQP